MLIACPGPLVESGFFGSLILAAMASPWAYGLLAFPACAAVQSVAGKRFAPLLDRGPVERLVVLASSLVGACSAVLHAVGIAAILDPTGRNVRIAQVLLAFIAPAPLGAIPWAAGELVGRESAHRGVALFSSMAVAYLISLIGFALLEPRFPATSSPAMIALQSAVTPLAAVGAACAYLALRGKALEPAPPEAVALDRMASIIPAR